MVAITEEAAELFKEGAPQSVRISVEPETGEPFELTESDILFNGFQLNRASVTGDRIELGSVIAAELTLKLDNYSGKFDDICFEGASLFVRVGVKKPETENEFYFVPFGYFTVDDAPKSVSSISVVALDRMMRFDKKAENLVFPMTVKALIEKSCEDCNVPLGTDLTQLPNYDYVIKTAPSSNNLLYRQLLSWCAQITGTCAFIDGDGKLQLKWYTPTDVEITASDRFSSFLDENAITVTGIKFSGEAVYLGGTDDYVLDLTGNLLIQSEPQGVVDNLFSAIGGFCYVPFSATVKPFPQLMPLDMLTFVVPGKTQEAADTRHTVIITDWTFALNRNTSIMGQGKSSTKNSYGETNPFTPSQMANVDEIFAKNINASGVIRFREQSDGTKLIIDMAKGKIKTDDPSNMFDSCGYLLLDTERISFSRGWTFDNVEDYDLFVKLGSVEYSESERASIETNNAYMEIYDCAQLSVYGLLLTRVYNVISKETGKSLSTRIVKRGEIGFAKTLPISSGGTGGKTSNEAIKNLGLQRSTASVKYNPTEAYGSNKDGNGYTKVNFGIPYKAETTPTVTVSLSGNANPLEHAILIAEVTNEYFIVKYQHSLSSTVTASFRWIAVGSMAE